MMNRDILEEIRNAHGRPRQPSNDMYERNAMGRSQAVKSVPPAPPPPPLPQQSMSKSISKQKKNSPFMALDPIKIDNLHRDELYDSEDEDDDNMSMASIEMVVDRPQKISKTRQRNSNVITKGKSKISNQQYQKNIQYEDQIFETNNLPEIQEIEFSANKIQSNVISKKLKTKQPQTQQKIERPTITTDMLALGLNRLKSSRTKFERVKINPEQVMALFEKRDYFPLSTFIETINQKTVFGDYEFIVNLSLTGIEQVTDLLFYHMMSHIIELPNLSIINVSGCHNVTDAGMKWCTQQFPYLSQIFTKGCEHLTERTVFYCLDTPYSVLEQIDMTCTDVSSISGKFKQSLSVISLLGCPLISPSTEVYHTKKRNALLDVNLSDLTTYKVVVLKDKDSTHSFTDIVTKKTSVGRYLKIYENFKPENSQYSFNIYEVETGMGLENLVLSNGGIVVLTYTSIGQDTVNRLTKQLVYLLIKCPESIFVIADLSETGGKTSASVAREVVNSLELWSEKFGADHTAQLADLMMDFTFQQQQNFVKALTLLENIHYIQKNQETNYKCILDIDMSGGKCSAETLKFLEKSVFSLRERYPWHGNTYHPLTVDWFNKSYSKTNLRLGHLKDILNSSSDAVKFNMNSREAPYREMDKLFELRTQRGRSVYFPKMSDRPGFVDLLAMTDFYNKTCDMLCKPSQKASVVGLGPDYPCFTKQDLHNFLLGTKEENDIYIKILEENLTIIKLPLSHKHPKIGDPTVYVVGEQLPDKPHIPLEHFWDGKFENKLYSGRKYRIPVLPDSLLLMVIRHFVKIAKVCLIWKNGAILQQGPVTYMLEIFRQGDYPGVLIEAKLHSKAKPGDETYLEADRMVWKSLRGITAVFDSVLVEHEVFFVGEFFYYEEKIKFDRNEALEWFSGVREKPYMCDSLQKLVPNHTMLEIEQGTRCYQCDNCGVNNIDCPENLSNYRYRNECGCRDYKELCKTCGMCTTCVHAISKAVSTVQPSFRMIRDTNKENLTVTGSIISFGTNNLEYTVRSNMSYEVFSHLRIVLLRGISYKMELSNIIDGQKIEMIRYNTGEGKIEIIGFSNHEQKVKETTKKRGLDCHSGFILEICLTQYDLLELRQNGRVIQTWELSGPFVQVSLTSNDPGNIMLTSNHYVDFQDISSPTGNQCCELSLPSCAERKMTSEFVFASNLLFGEGKDFSGSAACVLPGDITELDLQYPNTEILNKNRILMPLCLTKNRFSDEWNLNRMLHLVNSAGFPVPADDSSVIDVGLACNLFLSHYPYINIPENFQNFLRFQRDRLGTSLIEKGMQEIIRLMGIDLIMEVGLNYSMESQLPALMRKSFVNVMEPFMLDSEKSGLHPTDSILQYNEGDKRMLRESERILFLCEGHKASYHSRGDYTDLSPSQFGGYARFIRDIKIVKSALVSIPEDLFTSMPYLIRVEMYENLLEKIPESIGSCKYLQVLDFADNNLKDLPQSLVNCTQLYRLDIGRNIMDVVPSVIPKLKLKRLMLNSMLLTSLPENIGDMDSLEMLYATGNCFTKLPKSICKLKNLQDLSIAGVQWVDYKEGTTYTRQAFDHFLSVTRVGPWLDAHNEDKQKLFQQFDLDANNVLDSKEIGNLNATLFNIFPRFGYKGKEPPEDDAPSGFPEEIFELTSLKYLNLQYHGIVHVPEGIGKLTNLETLVLSYNPNLLSVAAQCGLLPLKRLELANCALLKTPPKEIRERGFSTVYAYLRRLMFGSVECKRTKLMFVGLGGAGKTSLVKALMTQEFQSSLTGAQAITDGIDICTWTVNMDGEKVQYSVWDFAGQTVYYNTHQFFLSNRAVYLLLWNVRLGQEHAGLNFWLSSISVHASKAPIFIVGTHMDQVPKAELPIEEMKAAYPQIEGFFFVSSFTGQGMEELKSSLLQVTLKQEYMGEKIPAAYLELENIILRKRQDDVNLVEYSEVEKMANNAGIVEKEEVAQAVQFLHDLGSVQHFSNEVLKSKVVINPQWIVDVMARVVSVKESPIQDGKLNHSDIGKVWKEYPSNIHFWLLQLTEEYDLTFKLANEKVNLVPCLLPEKKPEVPWPDLKKESGYKETKMLYNFEYLPAGLFNRAQVRLQEFSDHAIIWKRGSFLRKNEHIALLHQNKDTEMIVKVQGPRPENVLFLVHEVFEALINESFHGVKYDFSVPCPDCNELVKRDPHMFAASMIRRAIDLQAPFLQCLKYFHTISVSDLQSIMPPDTTKDYDIHLAHAVNDLQEFQKDKTLDLFISYCDLDAPKDKSNVIHPEDVTKELLKEDYKCFFPEKKHSTDMVAKSLIESSIFIALVSNNYVNDQECCNLFKFAKQTLRKPFIVVAVGPNHEWKKSPLGLLVSDVVFVNMIDSKKSVFSSKMQELLDRIKEIYSVEKSDEHPPCFISYCWRNSKEAVELGTKSDPKAYAYTPDPRDIAGFLTASGVPCWLDTKRIGFGMSGLLDDIAKGLLNSQIMISFVSDEYAASNNSITELNFAALTLHIPIIMAIVGQGNEWKTTELNLLAFKQQFPLVDFRELSENEGKEKLLSLALGYLKEFKSNAEGDQKTKKKNKKQESSDKKDNLSFQELYELAQRKFHHQITQYAQAQDTGLPYPRLFVVDIWKSKEKKEEKSTEENKPVDELEISFRDGQYCVHTLCECEAGWHTVSDPIPLEEDFGKTSLTYYTPYLSRITALMRHNNHFTMNASSDKHGVAFLRYLVEASAVELSECKTEYYKLREKVIGLDFDRKMGGLSRCRLPSGKIIWLCQDHISKMKVTLLTNEMIAHEKTTSGVIGVDYMLESLREMDPATMKLSFKSCKKAKRQRTAPKDSKEQVNLQLQKKQSLLRQKSLINDDLLAEYKAVMSEAVENDVKPEKPAPKMPPPKSDNASTLQSKQMSESYEKLSDSKKKTDNIEENVDKPSGSGIGNKKAVPGTAGPSDTPGKRPTSARSMPKPTNEVKTKEPDNIAKMGRSKSKACSIM